jgi:hypothetical protein
MAPVTKIKVAILESDHSQASLARAIPWLTESRLSQIVNGLHADERTWDALAQELDRNVDDIRHPATPQTRDIAA